MLWTVYAVGCAQHRSNEYCTFEPLLAAVVGLLFMLSALKDGRGLRIGAFFLLLCLITAWLGRFRL